MRYFINFFYFANFLLMKFLKSLFTVTFFSSSYLNESIWWWKCVVSFEVTCFIVGVFGNTGEAGESFIGIFVVMGVNTSPSLTSTLHQKCPNSEFFSGLYFPSFGMNTEKYGPEKTPYLDAFHAVLQLWVYWQLAHTFVCHDNRGRRLFQN